MDMFDVPESPRRPLRLTNDDPHPIYDISFDDILWAKRLEYENAYAHAFNRRFGFPPTNREAFNWSYQLMVIQQMTEAKLGKLQKELEEFIDNAPPEEDELLESVGNR